MQSASDTHQRKYAPLETSTTAPRSYSNASEKSADSDHDYVDDLVTLYDPGLGTLDSSSWTFGSTISAEEDRPRRTGRLSLKSNKYHANLRVSLRMKFYFLNERVLSFELGLRQFTRAWASIATTDCRLSVVNIRPVGSRVFELCKNLDFDVVKSMLEEGRASIYDVDNAFNHSGLLDYTMRQGYPITNANRRERLKLCNYLIHQGHNSANFVQNYRYSLPPAILSALEAGETEMLSYGMTFGDDSDGINPFSFLSHQKLAVFREELALMSSLRVLRWDTADQNLSLSFIFRYAIRLGSVSDVVFSIEIVGEDIQNSDSDRKMIFLRELMGRRTVCGVETEAVLNEYGFGTALIGGIYAKTSPAICPVTDLSHWFLFKDMLQAEPFEISTLFAQTFRITAHEGVEPSVQNARLRPWTWFWSKYRDQYEFDFSPPCHDASSWEFGPTVIETGHLLMHGASWSQLLGYIPGRSYPRGPYMGKGLELTALDIAKAWSDAPVPLSTVREGPGSVEEQEERWVDAACFHVTWSNNLNGTITRTRRDDEAAQNDASIPDSSDSCSNCKKSKHLPENNASSGASTAQGDEHSKNTNRTTPPTDALFAAAISTPQGRRRMQRYPLVKALTYALQLAGYRVEMDDEGDLWFDDDGGDPYSDAVEHIQDLDKTGPIGGTCPICRDPEAYGLGHVPDRAEDGLAEWRRERQKFVDRGALRDDEWVWPSWTRRGGRR